MEDMEESLGPKERKKQAIINVKIKWVDGHLLVNFRYNEDEIYHNPIDVLEVLREKIEELKKQS